jgi:hypothetical protein
VAIAAASLAWEAGDNEFDAKVSEVSREGFLITFVARSERQVREMKVNWFATDDPRVKVLYFSTENASEEVYPVGFGVRDS